MVCVDQVSMDSAVAQGLDRVREGLTRACQRCGRRPQDVRLVAVSKLQPAAAIRAAYAAGQRDFGENYAQELRDKAKELADLTDLRWHVIGSLQSNKVKYVVPVASRFHALDDAELAEALNGRLATAGRTLEVLLEVNVGREAQKHGVLPEELGALVDRVRPLPQLRLVGLMCIPPLDTDAESHRPHFRQLRELAQVHALTELSMGMSDDFEVAIQEGATIIRVGTAIFGHRPPRG